jgi:hypothetical protein
MKKLQLGVDGVGELEIQDIRGCKKMYVTKNAHLQIRASCW